MLLNLKVFLHKSMSTTSQTRKYERCCGRKRYPFFLRISNFPAGSCYFSWKVVLAEEAGALAVIIYDTVERQSTAVLAIAGPFPNPRTDLKPVTFLRFRASSHVCIAKILKLITLWDSLGFFGFVPEIRGMPLVLTFSFYFSYPSRNRCATPMLAGFQAT